MRITPAISVVLPVCNAAHTVERALDGLLSGSLQDIEVIAVDDGSTDGSGELLDSLSRRDRRLRVIHGPHRGLVAALNAGLAEARAPHIARMDADDRCHPERLARQLAFLESSPEIDLVGCQVELERAGAEIGPGMARFAAWINDLIDPDAIARRRFVETPFVHGTVMGRRHAFEAGYRAGHFPEDYELWLRGLQAGLRFAKLAEPLYTWRVRSDSLTHTHPSCSADAFRQLKLDYLLRGPLSNKRAIVWGTGRNGKRWIRALRDRGVAVPLAVDLDPRKIGRRIHGADVIPPDALPNRALPLVAAVGKPGGREWIADWLTRSGYIEGDDYWAVC